MSGLSPNTYDKANIDVLRIKLRRLRVKATRLGTIDHMIEEAYDNLDVDCALYWERVAAGYVKNRKKLAKRLMDTEYAIVEAGVDVPNPNWISPPWLLQEWMASVEELSEVLFGCPPEAQIYYGAGKEYMDEGEYRQAVEEFSKCIDSFPEMANAFIGRGIASAYWNSSSAASKTSTRPSGWSLITRVPTATGASPGSSWMTRSGLCRITMRR